MRIVLFFYISKWQNKVYEHAIILRNKGFFCSHRRFPLFSITSRNIISFILNVRIIPFIFGRISQCDLRGRKERMNIFDRYIRKRISYWTNVENQISLGFSDCRAIAVIFRLFLFQTIIIYINYYL